MNIPYFNQCCIVRCLYCLQFFVINAVVIKVFVHKSLVVSIGKIECLFTRWRGIQAWQEGCSWRGGSRVGHAWRALRSEFTMWTSSTPGPTPDLPSQDLHVGEICSKSHAHRSWNSGLYISAVQFVSSTLSALGSWICQEINK